jgi:hypothetical protein
VVVPDSRESIERFIQERFHQCTSIEELTAAFKKLSKEYHPGENINLKNSEETYHFLCAIYKKKYAELLCAVPENEKKHYSTMEKISPKQHYEEFKNKLESLSNEELVALFNNEVNIEGWVSARASFLAALHKTFVNRRIDIDEIGDEHAISLERKIEIQNFKVKTV